MLQTGDIVFYTRKRVLGKLIKIISKSKVSHCGIVVDLHGTLKISEATECGIVLSDINILDDKEHTILRHKEYIKLDYIKEQYLRKRIVSKLNTKYDYISLLFYQVMYQVFGKWYGKTEEEADDKLYCSEYVAWIYELKNWWLCSPDDVFNNNKFILLYSTVYTT